MGRLDRREFIALLGGLGALAGDRAAAEKPSVGPQVVYRGKSLRQVAMPMGGLGAGSVTLGGSGNLRNWQIFNQCNPQAQLAASFFAIWAQAEGQPPVAKLLQCEPVGALPTIDAIEFSGEYPFAWTIYKDAALPVQVKMEAYSPLIPMNAKDSGLPGVVFRFAVKNPGSRPLSVSLAQTCQNAVGYDGFGSFDEAYGCQNLYVERGSLRLLRLMTKESANGVRLEKPVVLLTDSQEAARRARFFENADLRYVDSLLTLQDALTPTVTARIGAQRGTPPPNVRLASEGVFDTPDAPVVVLTENLDPVKRFALLETFVREGGGLVVTGGAQALLEATLPEGAGRPVILFEDFEAAQYDSARWTVEGEAFGDGPARGSYPDQQPVSGFEGGGLVNSYRHGDGPTGKMISKPFPIERRYIHFLIGGGNHPDACCMNLRVGGRVVRTATGQNNERLLPAKWDVMEFAGQQGVLEIVDRQQDAWGHISVDEIVFSDLTTSTRPITPERRQQIRDFLPFDVSYALEGALISFKDFLPKRAAPDLTLQVDASGMGQYALWRHGRGRVAMVLADVNGSGPGANYYPDHRRSLLPEFIGKTAGIGYTLADGMPSTHPYFGSMALATGAEDVTRKEQWDQLEAFWKDFAEDGRLDATTSLPAEPGKTWNGALAAYLTLAPGEEKEVVFWLGWHFPNRYRDRTYDVGFGSVIPEYEIKYRLGNRYNAWFGDAGAVVDYLCQNDASLRDETRLFHDTFYDSTLPTVLLDALSSQISTLRSQTSMWLENGRWMAYEGLGCCPMNCTHVYNYAQTLAKLFPELERDVRRTDLTVQLQDDGGVRHRVQLPFDVPRATGPFADGHLSTISKAYREHRQSADDSFLREFWPAIKKAMEYAIRTYDSDGDGMVEGRQPNTYDCDVFGHNSFVSTQYLAALRAAAEMAQEQGDADFARRCRALFEQGSKNLDAACWNGEYYQQVYADYLKTPTQYGPGCLADQALGQWWAHLNGLGYLLPPERVRAALQAVLKHNFITDFTHWDYHGQRVFADGRDRGLVCCTWPKGGRPEKVAPILYCDEVWTGVEYQFAGHLMFEGRTAEALQVVTALRARYDGVKRNPWNEIECSDHYGRAMASWSLLLAASGCQYHGPQGALSFAPRLTPEAFRAFFTTAQAWGTFAQQRSGKTQENTLRLAYGAARLNVLRFALPGAAKEVAATPSLDARPLPATAVFSDGTAGLAFPEPLTLQAGQTLRVVWKWD